MTVLDALRHQWRRWVRSPTFGRSLIGKLLLVLAAAYFGLLFVSLGWFYPEVMAEVAPEQKPLRLLNEYLLYAAAALVVYRFFLQRSAGSDVEPYLGLPIRRPQLVRVMQALSAFSLLNVLSVVVLASFWGSTVVPATSMLGTVFWAVGGLLVVAATQFLNSLLRAAWGQNAGLVLGGVGVLAVVVAGSNWLGFAVLRQSSAWLFGGLAAGQVGPLLLLIGVAGSTAGAAHWVLRTRLYDVLGEEAAGTSARPGPLFGRRWGQGPVTTLALLDARLILRNKRPRQMLLLGTFMIAMFCLPLFAGDATDFNKILLAFFLSGYLGLMIGQFGYAWHGNHFDRLLLHTASPVTLVRAQFVTIAGLCAAPLLVGAPIVGALKPALLTFLFAFLVYNLGVAAPALILMGTWRREALEIDQTAFFNYQGTSSGSFLYGMIVAFGVMGLPLALVMGTGVEATLLVVGGLGTVGLLTVPVWTRGLGRVLHWQRHAMAAGFREE